MIGLALDDGAGSVELLDEDKSYHLMGESHAREAEHGVGTTVYLLREAIGTADDEHQAACCLLLALQPVGKLNAPRLLATLVQKHHRVRRLQQAEYSLSLLVFLLLLAEALGIAQLWDNGYGERHVVAYPFEVIVDGSNEMLVGGLAYYYQLSLHIPWLSLGSWGTILS